MNWYTTTSTLWCYGTLPFYIFPLILKTFQWFFFIKCKLFYSKLVLSLCSNTHTHILQHYSLCCGCVRVGQLRMHLQILVSELCNLVKLKFRKKLLKFWHGIAVKLVNWATHQQPFYSAFLRLTSLKMVMYRGESCLVCLPLWRRNISQFAGKRLLKCHWPKLVLCANL